jgi:Putative MetA-pathway of phenol degradation
VDLDLTIREDVFALFATYGLTRNWDVGVVLPIVHLHLRADAQATIVRNSPISQRVHNFGPQSDPPRSTGGGDETGIGDIILRTKYNFLRDRPRWPDLALVGDIKLPTGDEDDLLGTGDTNLRALLVASRSFGWLTPHVNFGFEWTTAGSEQNNVRYVAGVDARVHPRLTVAVDVLGRWEPNGDGIGDQIVDLGLGAKWNIFQTFLLNAGVQFPLNRNEGLRANVIWTVGIENTF